VSHLNNRGVTATLDTAATGKDFFGDRGEAVGGVVGDMHRPRVPVSLPSPLPVAAVQDVM